MNISTAPIGPARSAYLRQVEQIFSGELRDRGRELAELANFCRRDDGPAYVWWQAPAWAGKSALMVTLALHPPAGVRVVSFFITARWAGQSDRAAFLETVLTQLAEITGQPLPDVLTESNRQQWFLQLLSEAAQACAADGHRLVLLVDGLDEDRGVTRAADGHSIAALLPGKPPSGMKVVVAGRPNPPVPADVPDWHPLRDRRIVQRLEPSRWAVAMRDAAQRELDGLLDGGGLGRELLGLLVVAGGGLSGSDLAELTGEPEGEVERILHTVTGRSFTSHNSQWVPSPNRLFVLAHEELVHIVLRSLRPVETADCRKKIHAWAEWYRRQGWPANTPEYLLRGYSSMLLAAEDVERMRAVATDWARLDRMLDVSGGDAAAMADIIAAQEYIRDHPNPDLTASLHLALTRHNLTLRNSNIPSNLPAAWALLGNPNRAQALAGSITSAYEEARALAEVVEALVQAGDLDRAESAARSITSSYEQERALITVVEALLQAGELDRAE
ncbi:hypothetical protein, partial [Actinomadura geliboluensis]|uniref:hypothetical protein n=1 Tax=Actinomadura geliboluensis TaxID=882440 RepID=UPI003683C640